MNPQQPSVLPIPGAPKKGLAVVVESLLGILFIVALAFGIWAYMGKQTASTNLNAKIADAVAKAKTDQAATLQASFDEKSKSPNKTFSGSATYGSITFSYPKTWSAYVDSTNNSSPINAYFAPDQVPAVQGDTAYALRVELVSNAYSDVVSQINSSSTSGTVKATAYTPPKLKDVANAGVGTKFDGTLSGDGKKTGSMVIMKVRDKTLKISTESNDYLNDFNNTILPSLTFAP